MISKSEFNRATELKLRISKFNNILSMTEQEKMSLLTDKQIIDIKNMVHNFLCQNKADYEKAFEEIVSTKD